MIKILVVLAVVSATRIALGAVGKFDDDQTGRMDRAVAAAIELQMTPGAVVVAGTGDAIVFQKAYGHMTYESDSPAMKVDTIFDLASLSKSVGCASSVMVLIDRDKLSVHDKASKYLPGLDTPQKKDITIEELLLHQAGFPGDNPVQDYVGTRQNMFDNVFKYKLSYRPGTDYIYSDMNFITLGAVVEAVTGERLDKFAQDNVFTPLKMKDTMYNPPASLKDRCAPTEKRDGKWIVGQVHDPRAYALGGVAGHAGVFSTAGDVARFCQMILNHGELDGTRIVSEKTWEQWTKPRPLKNDKGETFVRAYGFDVDTKMSPSPRGRRFPKGTSFGHTGYTGTSYWIDPADNVFVVLLTNRVHPDDDAEIGTLRKRVATIAAEAMLGPKSN
jgi:CubicO group peptidase (beta-lactamase class C family)